MAGLVLLAVIVFIWFASIYSIVKRYVRVPPNQILVIYGKVENGKSCKVLLEGGTFVWPVFQVHAFLSTEPFVVPLPSGETLAVCISRNEASAELAAERLLGLSENEKIAIVRDHLAQAEPERDLVKLLAKFGLESTGV